VASKLHAGQQLGHAHLVGDSSDVVSTASDLRLLVSRNPDTFAGTYGNERNADVNDLNIVALLYLSFPDSAAAMSSLLASGIAGLTTLGSDGVTRPALPDAAFALPVPHSLPHGLSAWLSHAWLSADSVVACNTAGLLVVFAVPETSAPATPALMLRLSVVLGASAGSPDIIGTSIAVTKSEIVVGCSDGTVRHLSLPSEAHGDASVVCKRTVRLLAPTATLLPPVPSDALGPNPVLSVTADEVTSAVTRVSLSPTCRTVYATTAAGALHCYATVRHSAQPSLHPVHVAPQLQTAAGGFASVAGATSQGGSVATSRR
jgi:hypothetical protein